MTQPTRSIKELNAYIDMAEDSSKGAIDYSVELAKRIENKSTLVSDYINRKDTIDNKLDFFYNEVRETNNELMRIGAPDHEYQTPMTKESAGAATKAINGQLRDYKESGNYNRAQNHFADVMVANAHGVCQLNWNRAGLEVKDNPILENAKRGHNLAVKPPENPGMSL